MPVLLPYDRLHLLNQVFPSHYLEHEPFVSISEAHTYPNLTEDLHAAVNQRGSIARHNRRWGTALAVGLGGAAVAGGASLAWGMIPAVLWMPIAAASKSTRLLAADPYGDNYIEPAGRRVAKGVVPVIESLAVGSIFGGLASLIPTYLVGIPGLTTTLAASCWYYYVGSNRIRPKELPQSIYLPTVYDTPGSKVEQLRGSQVVPAETLLSDALWDVLEQGPERQNAPPVVRIKPWDYFGGLPIRRGLASNNSTLFVGMPGSGKTSFLRVLMGTLLPATNDTKPKSASQVARHESRQETAQAIVYDAKTEHIPVIVGHGYVPQRTLFILNPFDKRSVAWDMARDIRRPAQAAQLADMLTKAGGIKEAEAEKPFFTNNARNQIQAVIETFIQCGGEQPKWRLSDVINAFTSIDILRHVLSHHSAGEVVIGQTLDINYETATNIFTSTATSLSKFRILASLWSKKMLEAPAPGTVNAISIDEWLATGHRSILLLPNTRENDTIIRPLNELMFNRLTEMMLDKRWNKHQDKQGGTAVRRAVILDECPQLGKLDKLTELMAQGRSFGVQVVLGVQAYSQMESAYGKEDAKTILGMCSHKAFLKCDGDTAEWASKQIGQQLQRYATHTYTTGQSGSRTNQEGWTSTSGHSSGGGSSSSSNSSSHTVGTSNTEGWNSSSAEAYQERTIETVLPSELSSLPDPKRDGRISGFFMAPGYPVFSSTTEFEDVYKMSEASADVPERDPVDASEEWLRKWEGHDYERLGLRGYQSPNKQGEPGTDKCKQEEPRTKTEPRAKPGNQFPDLF